MNLYFTPRPVIRRRISSLLLFFVLLLSNQAYSQSVVYVKQNASGTKDGKSWANAFTDLSIALNAAQPRDTIRIAKGIYKPGTSQTDMFRLKDSLVILGGYPDSGNPSDAERDFTTHLTVLSGDIGIANNFIDNTPTIVFAVAKDFLFDGFIIENAYTVMGNYDAVFLVSGTGTGSRIRNTVFRNNTGVKSVITTGSKLDISNCFFERNEGEFVIRAVAGSDLILSNSVIASNSSSNILSVEGANVKILHATAFRNKAQFAVRSNGTLTVQNSILYFNNAADQQEINEFTAEAGSSLLVQHSLTEIWDNAQYGVNLSHQPPHFIDTSRIAGADGKYFTNDDGLRVMNPCSPAINTGDNSLTGSLLTDITGKTRISNNLADMGAYEVQEAIAGQPRVLYVNKNATGQNTGLSWQDALTDLQAAFNLCSDTIKVAKGSYPISSTDSTAYYQLSNNRVVIGGYSGQPGDNIFNPTMNPTVLEGKINSTVMGPTVIMSRYNDSTSRLIGFEVANTFKSNNTLEVYISPVKIGFNGNPYFSHLKIDCSKNKANHLLIIQGNSRPVFEKTVFYNRYTPVYAETYIRAITVRGNSRPVFKNCYTGKDTTVAPSGNAGAQFIITDSKPSFDSCMFYVAAGNAVSGTNSSILIENTIFRSGENGSIFGSNSQIQVRNSCFYDTTTINLPYVRTIRTEENSNSVFENCRFIKSSDVNGEFIFDTRKSRILLDRTMIARKGITVFYAESGDITLKNCISFTYADSTRTRQGGRFIYARQQSSAKIINSTIIQPTANEQLTIQCDTVKFYNSISWRYGYGGTNSISSSDINTLNNNNPLVCDIRNSMLYRQINTTMTNSTSGVDPKLTSLPDPFGKDSLGATKDDGISLCDCSYALNRGDNSLNSNATDITGAERIAGGTIDIGAYELDVAPAQSRTLYVRKNASPGGDGRSWTTAYNNLQAALQYTCTDTIKIAKGIYTPAERNRDSSFSVFRGITLLGGYPDNGNPSDAERDSRANPTILSGDIGVPGDSLDNSHTVIELHCPDSIITLDGLIIERGNYNGSGIKHFGGGISAIGSKQIVINNCIIRNNYSSWGAGIYIGESNIRVTNSVITNNTGGGGGGFYLFSHNAPRPAPWQNPLYFRNCVLANNKGAAGRIDSDAGFTTPYRFENVIFYKNEGSVSGGLEMSNGGYVRITGCSFIRNNKTFTDIGAAIYVFAYELNTSVYNTIFHGNTIAGQATQLVNADFAFKTNSDFMPLPYTTPDYSAASAPLIHGGSNNIQTEEIGFRDLDNPMGADNTWMTEDDGLQLSSCSQLVDKGSNTYAADIATDILGRERIRNNRVDIGPYEIPAFTAKIMASDSVTCPGTLITFTSQITNAGPSPSYQWTVNGIPAGTNSASFSSTSLQDGDKVMLKVKTQNCNVNDTAFSNIISIRTGNNLTPAVSISASDTSICAGSPVTFTASTSPVNATIIYQWKVNNQNAGTNSPVFTTSDLIQGDSIHLQIIVNAACISTQPVNSNGFKIRVKEVVTPSVSITASQTIACSGSVIEYTAAPLNEGENPHYQWKVNGMNSGQNSPVFSSALNNNDIVSLVMNSNASCAGITEVVSNSITQQVSMPVQPSVLLTASDMTCPGTAITFTASVTNGGAAPVFQWLQNGNRLNITGSTFTSSAFSEGDVIQVSVTGNAPCLTASAASSTPVIVHYASAVTPTVSISGPAGPVCVGSPLSFTATAKDAGSNPVYKWYVNYTPAAANTNVFTTSTLKNGDVVKAVITSSLSCTTAPTATSNQIIVNISGSNAPSVVITASQAPICPGDNVIFTATASNTVGQPSFQWTKNGVNVSTGTSYNPASLATGDVIRCIMTATTDCGNSQEVVSNSIYITLQAPAKPTITFASGQLVATVMIASYQWYYNDVLIPGANAVTYTPTNSGLYKVEVKNASGCKTVSDAFNVLLTAVGDVDINGTSVNYFPNPANERLYIKFSARPTIPLKARLMDNTGRVFREMTLASELETIDVSAISTGLYFLHISDKKGEVIIKVVIAR